MMIRDFYCTKCSTVAYDVYVSSNSQTNYKKMRCEKCDEETVHMPVCNGGTGSRYRYNDWSYDAQRSLAKNEIKFSGINATEGSIDGPPVTNKKTGEVISGNPKYRKEPLDERRERVYHNIDRRHGKTGPIYNYQRG